MPGDRKPGAGWFFESYGRRVVVAAIPRIGNYRLHLRLSVGRVRRDGLSFGVWVAPDEGDGPWDLTVSIGTVSLIVYLVEFWPWEAPDAG